MRVARLLVSALVVGYVRINGLRALVTLVAVALGVAAAYAIDLANATAIDSFGRSVDVIANHVNLQVFGSGTGFDERALLRVERTGGVTSASPVIEGELVAGARRGDPQSGEIVRVLGIDVTRAALPDAVRSAQGSAGAFDLHAFIDGRGIIVSRRIAERYVRNGRLRAYAGAQSVDLPVLAVIPPGSVGVDSSVAFVDIATAQEVFHRIGSLDRIDAIVEPAKLAAVRSSVARAMPPGARVLEPHTRLDEIRRMLSSFQMNLAVLADVALLVGMYLIYNAVAISVVQRKSEIGTLRALGVSRKAIFATFVGEGALYGTIGAVAGVLLGFLLARFSVAAVQTTVSTLFVGSHSDAVVFSWPATFKAFATGIVLAMLSALAPAAEAASTPPARTMRAGAGSERAVPGLSRWSAFAGIVMLACAGGLMRLPAIDGVPLFGYAAGVLLIAGASLCTPLVLAAAVFALRLLRAKRPSATIAAGFLRASPRRFSVAIASLAVAVAMMVSIAVLVGSFRSTVVAWTADTLGADLYIKTPGAVDASFRGGFTPSDVMRISRVAGVAAVDTYRGFDVPIRGRFASLGATDVRAFASRNKLRFIGHVDLRQLARAMRIADTAVVSEPFSTHFGLQTGDSFELATPAGVRPFRILAVYNDYSTSGGTFVIDSFTYRRIWHDDTVDSIAAYVRPGADVGMVRTRIERAVAPLRIDVSTNRELRSFAIDIFDRTFAITSALYVVSMAIAVLGVVSTLFALVLERRLEIALLRYIGLDRAGVTRMVLAQAFVVGLLAGVLGILLGAALAADLIYVINRQSFGWLIDWHSPGWFYLEAVVMVVVAALVAAVYPARVASNIHMSEVLRVE